MMRRVRPLAFRAALATAVAFTLALVLGCVFMVGVSTHRQPGLRWDKQPASSGVVQLLVARGRLQFVIYDVRPPARSAPPPREWQAGARYRPGVQLGVQIRDGLASWLGADADLFRSGSNTYFVFGLFLGYPAALAWVVAWVLRPRRARDPHACATCGYDLRGSPEGCPECGTPRDAARP